MITVEYYPSGETSPLPEGKQQYSFETFDQFKNWVQNYVCVYCLLDYHHFHDGKTPTTLEHWLDMGCGCEIGVEDPQDMIDWDAAMVLPSNFHELIE